MNIQNKSVPLKIKYDMKIAIATGQSRTAKHWKNKELLWSEFVVKCGSTTRTTETVDEFKKFTKSQQDDRKDVGGFVGGVLKDGRRIALNLAWRQVVTLDADFAKPDFWNTVQLMLGDCANLIYSTHKHTPDNNRLRLVVLLSRPVCPDEYQAITRRMAADIGIDLFDGTTYEPHRLMYWPSTPTDGEFVFEFNDGPALDADEVLNRYQDWRDQSQWPEPTKAEKDRKKLADKQGDPLLKTGIIGAFCRTYSIVDVLEQFLSDVYTPCAAEGRYTYTAGTAAGGLILYEDKFAFSHHGTDPISGKLVNAFDLLRLHKFGELDEEAEAGTPVVTMPSYKEMLNYCSKDENVKQEIGRKKLEEAGFDFQENTDLNWFKKMEITNTGMYAPSPKNVLLILQNDPNLKDSIKKDEFVNKIVRVDKVPWRDECAGSWDDDDDASLRNYISTVYRIDKPRVICDSFAETLLYNKFHPIRDYLDSLVWDKVPRIDTLLSDYLSVEESTYTRATTRKMLVAAVKRIYYPGCKMDYCLVLIGPQGRGKSTFLRILGGKYYSDGAKITADTQKMYESIKGFWINELGELASLKKAEVEEVKLALSKQSDTVRVPYAKHPQEFKRSCVFFGSTNNDTFLRDGTGNRRFWPVETGIKTEKEKDINIDLPKERDQVWAEAKYYFEQGEELFLPESLEVVAREEQEKREVEVPWVAEIAKYLNTKLPENWDSLGTYERRNLLMDDDPLEPGPVGILIRDKVCMSEIWEECLGGRAIDLTAQKMDGIRNAMLKQKDWEKAKGPLRFKNYGRSRGWVRDANFIVNRD